MSEELIALDDALADTGEWCVLRRVVGLNPNQVFLDVIVRARVRSPNANELVSGYKQNDSVIIMSPTQILEAQWPGGQPSTAINPQIPRGGGQAGDKIKISGTYRNIESVNTIRINDEVVRYELRALGIA